MDSGIHSFTGVRGGMLCKGWYGAVLEFQITAKSSTIRAEL